SMQPPRAKPIPNTTLFRSLNLRETWIREECSTLVRLPCSSHVAAHGVCTEIKYVTVSAGAKQHGMTEEAFYFAIDEITCDDAPSLAIDDNEVEHFVAAVHLHL